MAEGGVPLREYMDALRAADQRLYDERAAELRRRLDESALDRQHIREVLVNFVPRAEYDRVLGQALDRINALERTVSRIYGGLAVIVLLATLLGVILRYVVG